jgi:hypothetical protein
MFLDAVRVRSGSGLGSEVDNSYSFVNVNKTCKIVVDELLDPLCRFIPAFLALRVYRLSGL